MYVEHEFGPLYNKDSKILILGSIPSIQSRKEKFYYAHNQNRFWQVLSKVFETETPKTIEEKKKLILDNNLALWDVLASCEINNSSDSSIKNPKVNDLNKIISKSKIDTIFTTGKKAYNLYQKYCYPNTLIKATYLPSTSSANIANYSLEQLVKYYQALKK